MDGYEFLNMSLKKIEDGRGYVLVVARGDGKTLLLGSDNAMNRLIMINGASPLEHEVRAYRTEHHAHIVADLAQRFRPLSDDGFGLWFQLEPKVLHAAIAEYDLQTGDRIRIGRIELGSSVWVRGAGAGKVVHITGIGAIRVELFEPIGNLKAVTAREWTVKPYIRAVA